MDTRGRYRAQVTDTKRVIYNRYNPLHRTMNGHTVKEIENWDEVSLLYYFYFD